MDNNQSNVRKLVKYIWPLVVLVGVCLILQRFTNFVSNTNANYILSSITQGLASLVALLFVIIFFLCQSTGRVSMLSQVLKPDGYFLLGIFVVSIIFPLIILKVGYTHFLINLSISMCAFCLTSLFPFIISVNEITKKFGIRNILANLEINKSTKNKYIELIDDLLDITPKEILNLESDSTVTLLIDEIDSAIRRNLISADKKEVVMTMLSQIGNLCLKERNIECFDMVKEKVGTYLKANCPKTGIDHYGNKREELCNLYLRGLSELLSCVKSNEECYREIRLSISEILMDPLLLIFDYLENGKNGTLKKNQEKLEESMLSFSKEGKISAEEYMKALGDLKAQHTHIEEEIISKFENRLKSKGII